MPNVEEMLDSILNEDSGYRMRNERTLTENEKLVYETIDGMTLEQLAMLEKKVNMRKERLEYLREQEKTNQNNW